MSLGTRSRRLHPTNISPDNLVPSLDRGLYKGGIRSGETLCHDINPARPITTVSLAANTYCMINGLSSRAPHAGGPRVQFSSECEQSH